MRLVFSPGEIQAEAPAGSPAMLNILLSTLDTIRQYAVNFDPAALEHFRGHLSGIRERLSAIAVNPPPDSVPIVSADIRNCVRDYRDNLCLFVERLRGDLRSTSEALNELLGTMQAGGDADHALDDELRRLEELKDCRTLEQVRAGLAYSTAHLREYADRLRTERDVLIAQLKGEIDCLHRTLEKAEMGSNIDPVTGLCKRSDFVRFLRRKLIAGEHNVIIQIRMDQLAELDDEVMSEIVLAFARRLKNAIPATARVGAGSANLYYAILERGTEAILDRIAHSCGGKYVYLRDGTTCNVIVRATAMCVERGPGDDLDDFLQRLGLLS